MTDLLTFTDKGIYCPPGDFYIDPWSPVPRAVITHAHSDHARFGMGEYLAHRLSIPVMKLRLNPDIVTYPFEYGETHSIRGVTISFHPAGHIPGSAQIRVEYRGEVWVASGDYKTEPDGLCSTFEPLKCHAFITESTFGLPIFQWKPQADLVEEIHAWWRTNSAAGITSILLAYSLGKAQRILYHLDPSHGPIALHGAPFNVTKTLMNAGLSFPRFTSVRDLSTVMDDRPPLVIAPPSAMNTPWIRRFNPHSIGCASGWMNVRGMKRRRGIEAGFVLSDHADFRGLLSAIDATGASKVFVTHGYTDALVRYLREKGLESHEVKTQFSGETLAPDVSEEGEIP